MKARQVVSTGTLTGMLVDRFPVPLEPAHRLGAGDSGVVERERELDLEGRERLPCIVRHLFAFARLRRLRIFTLRSRVLTAL